MVGLRCLLMFLSLCSSVRGWVHSFSPHLKRQRTLQHRTSSFATPFSELCTSGEGSSLLLLADGGGDDWRQYAVLATCLFVLGDVVLGSPFVNMILKPAKEASGITDDAAKPFFFSTQEKQEEPAPSSAIEQDQELVSATRTMDAINGLLFNKKKDPKLMTTVSTTSSREELDDMAQRALEKAQAILENSDRRAKNPTPEERLEDMKRNLDQEMQNLDDRMQE